MVNKQYNIQKAPKKFHHKFTKSITTPTTNQSNISDTEKQIVRNPSPTFNLDTISEENHHFHHHSRDKLAFNPYQEQSDYDNQVNNCEYTNTNNEIPINSIGRFQYILQMDKEMNAHNDAFDTTSGLKQNKSNSLTNNSINYLKFWKSESQSPMMPIKSDRNMRLNKLYRIFCQYSKWPLILILICAILGLIVYFIVLELNYFELNGTNGHNKNKLILNKKMTFEETLVFGNYLNNFVDQEDHKSNSNKYDRESDENTLTTNIINGHAANYNTTDTITTETFFDNNKNSTEFIFDQTTTENFDEFDEFIRKNENKNNEENVHPTKESFQLFGFTSGHQNNFGVPIEEDERWLNLLNIINIKNKNSSIPPTTDSSVYRTRVSPTLPIISKYEITTQGIKTFNNTDDVICQSTSLSLCRGVLHYDLTIPEPVNSLTSRDFQHFRHLIESQCSLRVAQFVCAVLEPECRPSKMGTLRPCKRICKSVLEPCAHIVASSEILTSTFDCDSYADSNDKNICEDPTKRAECYGNEFKCNDRSCIPIQWKCDNIKDCADGEDEENCKFCEQDEFRCPTNDKCIPDKWRCDGYEDCPDAADEYDCADYDDDTKLFSDFVTPRTFSVVHEQLPDKPNSRPYLTISGEDRLNSAEREKSTLSPNENEDPIYASESDTKSNEVQKTAETQHTLKQLPISKNLEHFQDSKEIMMTSDTETDYKYTSTGFSEAQSTAHTSPCPENELRCISGLCITTSQLCDKITDCPDGADEAMCVYDN